MEQASWVFVVAFTFQSIGVLLMWAQIQRTKRDLYAMAEFLAGFRMATTKHINYLQKKVRGEKENA